MSELREHLALIRENWDRHDHWFDALCNNLVRGHMKELEALVAQSPPPVSEGVVEAVNARIKKAYEDGRSDEHRRIEGNPRHWFISVADLIERLSQVPPEVGERAVMVCPQCEGEGGYPDGLDADACHTECTRCGGNGWIVNLAALQPTPTKEEGWRETDASVFAGTTFETREERAARTDNQFPPPVSGGMVKPSPDLIAHIARLLAADPVCGGRVASGTIEAIAGLCSQVPPGPVGEVRTAADLKRICRDWLDADDGTHWGRFERELDELIERQQP